MTFEYTTARFDNNRAAQFKRAVEHENETAQDERACAYHALDEERSKCYQTLPSAAVLSVNWRGCRNGHAIAWWRKDIVAARHARRTQASEAYSRTAASSSQVHYAVLVRVWYKVGALSLRFPVASTPVQEAV